GGPAPEGAWTFTVTATDDRNVTTTAQRSFSLDDTLGALTVTRGPGGGPAASFNLTRPATVVVRIERPSGAVVATIQTLKLAAGPHHASWQGRVHKNWAPAGRYQLRVL